MSVVDAALAEARAAIKPDPMQALREALHEVIGPRSTGSHSCWAVDKLNRARRVIDPDPTRWEP